MKKSLIALAVLAASGAAMAQSSVTLFGVMDVGVGHSSGTNSVTGLTNGGLNTSRLGVRGVEDLGGGLKAGFWLEAGINADTGDGNKNGAWGGGLQFKRRSTISLMGDNWGEVRLGRDNTAHNNNLVAFDPFGATGSGALLKDQITGIDDRKNNTISYFLPSNLGGFYGQVQYIFGEKAGTGVAYKPADATGASTQTNNGDGFAIRGGYANGPLDVAAGYGVARGGTAANSVDYKTFNLGASYKFAALTPMLLLASDRGNNKRVDMYSLGVKVPLGAGELRAAYTWYKDKKTDNADSQRLALGYGYKLSKRTELYAAVARMSNDDKAARKLGSSLSPTPNLGKSLTGYEIGLRHNF